jgi:hypothetical protein
LGFIPLANRGMINPGLNRTSQERSRSASRLGSLAGRLATAEGLDRGMAWKPGKFSDGPLTKRFVAKNEVWKRA